MASSTDVCWRKHFSLMCYKLLQHYQISVRQCYKPWGWQNQVFSNLNSIPLFLICITISTHEVTKVTNTALKRDIRRTTTAILFMLKPYNLCLFCFPEWLMETSYLANYKEHQHGCTQDNQYVCSYCLPQHAKERQINIYIITVCVKTKQRKLLDCLQCRYITFKMFCFSKTGVIGFLIYCFIYKSQTSIDA